MSAIPVNPIAKSLLPVGPNGTQFRLLEFPSTVQIIHEVSPSRSAIVAELPIPYDPQPRAWWIERIRSEVEPYLRKYGAPMVYE